MYVSLAPAQQAHPHHHVQQHPGQGQHVQYPDKLPAPLPDKLPEPLPAAGNYQQQQQQQQPKHDGNAQQQQAPKGHVRTASGRLFPASVYEYESIQNSRKTQHNGTASAVTPSSHSTYSGTTAPSASSDNTSQSSGDDAPGGPPSHRRMRSDATASNNLQQPKPMRGGDIPPPPPGGFFLMVKFRTIWKFQLARLYCGTSSCFHLY